MKIIISKKQNPFNIKTKGNTIGMSKNPIFLGNKPASFLTDEVKGEIVNFDKETYYKISNNEKIFIVDITF